MRRVTGTANYGPGVTKGDDWCNDDELWFLKKLHRLVNCQVQRWLLVHASNCATTTSVGLCPREEQARSLDCRQQRWEPVVVRNVHTLTVAKCPAQGWTMRRLCWNDQCDEVTLRRESFTLAADSRNPTEPRGTSCVHLLPALLTVHVFSARASRWNFSHNSWKSKMMKD